MKTTIFAFALFAAATPALADAPQDKTAYEFRIDAAAADTPEGAARIYADIRRHAVRVCRALENPAGNVTKAVRACRAEVASNAVQSIDKPLVTALWGRDEDLRLAAS